MKQDFGEAQEAIFLDGLQYMREAATVAEGTDVTREDLLYLIANQGRELSPGQLGALLAFAVMRLIEEERAHAQHLDELRDAHNDLLNVRGILSPNGYEPKTPLPLSPTVAPAVEWLVGQVERHRLAWASARQRAANHLLALVDSDQERDALRDALTEANRNRIAMLQQHAGLIDALTATRVERDEARADVRKAGDEIRRLKGVLEATRAELGRAAERQYRVAQIRVWTNEDGKRFLFADEVFDALVDS
jgi:hypothetical protein